MIQCTYSCVDNCEDGPVLRVKCLFLYFSLFYFQCIPYSVLLLELDIKNLRILEVSVFNI